MNAWKNVVTCTAAIGLLSAQIAFAQAPPAAAPAAPAPAAAAPAVKAVKPFEIGQPALDFTIKNFEDKKDFVLSAELKKKKLLFVWLSSSCSSCLAEITELKKAQTEGSIKDTAVYVVSIDFNENNLQNYNDSYSHPDFTMLHDKDFASALKYGFRATPATLVIGRDGNIAFKSSGFQAGESKALLEALANTK